MLFNYFQWCLIFQNSLIFILITPTTTLYAIPLLVNWLFSFWSIQEVVVLSYVPRLLRYSSISCAINPLFFLLSSYWLLIIYSFLPVYCNSHMFQITQPSNGLAYYFYAVIVHLIFPTTVFLPFSWYSLSHLLDLISLRILYLHIHIFQYL